MWFELLRAQIRPTKTGASAQPCRSGQTSLPNSLTGPRERGGATNTWLSAAYGGAGAAPVRHFEKELCWLSVRPDLLTPHPWLLVSGAATSASQYSVCARGYCQGKPAMHKKSFMACCLPMRRQQRVLSCSFTMQCAHLVSVETDYQHRKRIAREQALAACRPPVRVQHLDRAA